MMKKLRFDKNDYLKINVQPLSGTSFVNWLVLLIENRLKIDWRFLPRALYVTMMTLLITPYRYREKKKYDQKLKNVKIAPLLFVVGHWRSGTTFMHYLMGHDKNLAYVSTFETMAPNLLLRYENRFKRFVKNQLPEKRPMDDLEMDADMPYEEEYAVANLCPFSFYHGWYFPKKIVYYFKNYILFNSVNDDIIEKWKNFYCYFLKKISYKNNGKRIMLKSLVNTGRIKFLLELFPDAKFIHIYRNPYKIYSSTWKLYREILPIFSFHHIKIKQLDDFIIWSYRELYKKYFEEKKLIPKSNLIEIRYEDFFNEPIKTLESIYKQFGLKGFEAAKPAFEKYIKKHEYYTPDNYNLDDDTKKKIYNEWSFAFKEFKYKK